MWVNAALGIQSQNACFLAVWILSLKKYTNKQCSKAWNPQRASWAMESHTSNNNHKPHPYYYIAKLAIQTPVHCMLLLATRLTLVKFSEQAVHYCRYEKPGVKMRKSNVHIISEGTWGVYCFFFYCLSGLHLWCCNMIQDLKKEQSVQFIIQVVAIWRICVVCVCSS